MEAMATETLHSLVPVSPARTHQSPHQRRQDAARRAYGAGAVSDRTSLSADALKRQAEMLPAETEQSGFQLSGNPHTRQQVRLTYGRNPSSAAPSPGSLIDIRI
jgi:hypothetical protein